jgi:hypothetical protein
MRTFHVPAGVKAEDQQPSPIAQAVTLMRLNEAVSCYCTPACNDVATELFGQRLRHRVVPGKPRCDVSVPELGDSLAMTRGSIVARFVCGWDSA